MSRAAKHSKAKNAQLIGVTSRLLAPHPANGGSAKNASAAPAAATVSAPAAATVPVPAAATVPATVPAKAPVDTTAPASSPAKGVAVLALGDAGEILAARDACEAIFGWDPTELVGRNVHVLLKDGLDNEIGRFLHRHRAGMNPAGTIEMNVVALRKDGREFSAHVTTLTWNWGTTASKDGSGDTSRLCWTAGFRDCSAETKPGQGPATAAGKSDVAEPAKQAPNPLVPATPGTPVAAAGASTNGTAKAEPAPLAPKAQVPANPNPNPNANAKPNALTTEQVATFETTRRIIELEEQLNKLATELAGAKTENEKLGCNASELRAQLDTAKEAAGHTEAALREETARREKMEERLQNLSNQLRVEQAERSQRFEEELVGLRKERDELNNRLSTEQQGANESVRRAQELEASLSRNASEFAHVKAELERQAAERQKSESCWREQLDTAWVAKKELEGAWAGAVEQNKRFEEELAKLRREQDELSQKLAAEQKVAEASKERAKEVESRLNRNAADSDRARTELEKENAERKRADAEKARLESSLAEANERVKRLEENLTALRQERDELQNRVKSEGHSTEDSSPQTEELQRLVQQHAAELERLTLDLEKQTLERQDAESRVSELETTAHDRAKKLEADWTAAVERNMQFEEQLVKARQEYDELNQKFAAEKQTAVEAERAQAELETERAERKRADADWREQLNAAKTLKTRLEKSLTEASEQATRLEEEIVALRSERDELQKRMKTEQQSAEESSRRADELQRQVDQNADELKQVTAELKQLSAERQEAEARAGEQQEAAQALTRKLEMDWTTAVERIVHFEEELVTLRKERDALVLQLKTEKRATADAGHQATELQRRLERNAAELQRLTAEVGKKRSERARAETEGRDQLEAAKALARKLDSAWTAATERSRRFEAEVAALRQERAELQGKLSSLQRESAHFKALAAQLQHQAGASAEPARGHEKVGPSRNGVEVPAGTNGTANRGSTVHPRRDVSLTNGHNKPQAEDATATGSAHRPAHGESVIPPRNGHEGKNGSPDHAQAAPRHAGDLQQYNFSELSGSPAQTETSTKKRLQP